MKIIVAIAHFFNPQGQGDYGCLKAGAESRISALREQITSFHQLFGKFQESTDYGEQRILPANRCETREVTMVICTTQDYHVLPQLSLGAKLWHHYGTNVQPMLLGFECQRILRESLGAYDYYCFMEDDLILHDPDFFTKLKWFNQQVGDRHLLQPNRYEISVNDYIKKTYIDPELAEKLTARFQNIREQPQLTGTVMGNPVTFRRTGNPHAGCYFLNAQQMAYWAQQPYFADRDTSFIGPLESAATLGIMRTFKIYKPAPQNANFLEIQHFGNLWSQKILNLIPRTNS
ncbi:calcium-binding protein [Planktothricoides raciborskii]|uniref:Calcium-binding protein n=1 Tax=Planktothricoides raciborskii GIHE-MW2 TaxID=2792601 RepID=A0AAU8J971_9CYAN